MAEDHERQREEDAVERETLEALASALKDVRPSSFLIEVPQAYMT